MCATLLSLFFIPFHILVKHIHPRPSNIFYLFLHLPSIPQVETDDIGVPGVGSYDGILTSGTSNGSVRDRAISDGEEYYRL